MSLTDSTSFVILDEHHCRMYPSLPEENSQVIKSSPPSLLQIASHNLTTSLPYSVYSSYAKKIQLKPDRSSKSLDFQFASIGNVLTVDDSINSNQLDSEAIKENQVEDTSILENILRGLSAENEILRKTLENSSEVMRKQLKAAQTWKQEAEFHKQSLNQLERQSLQQIQQLREENELLKVKLQNGDVDANETTQSVSPSAPAVESSFFWEDLSLQLQERMDHLQIMDQMSKEKQQTLNQTISQLDKAKSTISQLQDEMQQSTAASELLSKLKQQVDSITNVNQSEQMKNSTYESQLRHLSERFESLMSKTRELEMKIENANQLESSTAGEEGREEVKKHKHRRPHKHHTSRASKSSEGEKTDKQGHHGHHGRLLRRLAKHSHVANLASGIALKSVKEFKDGLKQASQESNK